MTVKGRSIEGFVVDHVSTCELCAAEDGRPRIARNAETIGAALAAAPAGLSPSRLRVLSTTVVSAALPFLEMQARRVYWRRLAAGLAVAVTPLPLVYVCGVWALAAAYGILSELTSQVIATWAVASYASLLVLVIALGCASIPLLVDRTMPAFPRRSTA